MRYWDRKSQGEFLSVTIKCPEGHLIEDASPDIYSSNQECDLCGSHGEITLTYSCAECAEKPRRKGGKTFPKSYEIQISSW